VGRSGKPGRIKQFLCFVSNTEVRRRGEDIKRASQARAAPALAALEAATTQEERDQAHIALIRAALNLPDLPKD
jgi:hypothetical protein